MSNVIYNTDRNGVSAFERNLQNVQKIEKLYEYRKAQMEQGLHTNSRGQHIPGHYTFSDGNNPIIPTAERRNDGNSDPSANSTNASITSNAKLNVVESRTTSIPSNSKTKEKEIQENENNKNSGLNKENIKEAGISILGIGATGGIAYSRLPTTDTVLDIPETTLRHRFPNRNYIEMKNMNHEIEPLIEESSSKVIRIPSAAVNVGIPMIGGGAVSTTTTIGGALATGTAGVLGGLAATGTISSAISSKQNKPGLTLPGHNYIGPGNELNNGIPIDMDDSIAQEHDIAYEQAKNKDDIFKADQQALNEFGIDFYENKNLHSGLGFVGIGIKHSVEKLLDKTVYPSMSYNEDVKRRAVKATDLLKYQRLHKVSFDIMVD